MLFHVEHWLRPVIRIPRELNRREYRARIVDLDTDNLYRKFEYRSVVIEHPNR